MSKRIQVKNEYSEEEARAQWEQKWEKTCERVCDSSSLIKIDSYLQAGVYCINDHFYVNIDQRWTRNALEKYIDKLRNDLCQTRQEKINLNLRLKCWQLEIEDLKYLFMIHEGRKPSMRIAATISADLLQLFYEAVFNKEARRRLKLMDQEEIDELTYLDQKAVKPEEIFSIETKSHLDMTEIPNELLIQSRESRVRALKQQRENSDVWATIHEKRGRNKELMRELEKDEGRINHWKESNYKYNLEVPIVSFDRDWTPEAYQDYIYKLQLELLTVKNNYDHCQKELHAWKIPYSKLSYRAAYENYADDTMFLTPVLERIKIERMNPQYRRPYFADE